MSKPPLAPSPDNRSGFDRSYVVEGILDDGSRDRIRIETETEGCEKNFTPDMGDSTFFRYKLKNGGHITSTHLTPPQDMTVTAESEDDNHIIIAQIALEGQTSFTFPGTEEFAVTPTQGQLFRYTGGVATYNLKGGSPIHTCGVSLYPEVFTRYLDNDIPDVLKPFLQDDVDGLLIAPFPVSQAMHSIISTGLDSGLGGTLQQMHMEGVALQYIALIADALRQAKTPPLPKLRQNDLEAADKVYDQLLTSLSETSSLSELAGSVGLSERRLTDAFREVYGGTVFEVMRNLRLEEARKLLEQKSMATKEVAWAVGYQHVSNFTNAFTDKFGTSPAKYAKTHCK